MPFVIVEKSGISLVRQRLQQLQLLREDERIWKLSSDVFAIPVIPSAQPDESSDATFSVNGRSYIFKQKIDFSPKLPKKPCELMIEVIERQMKEQELWKEELRREIPNSWVKYGDLILFGRNSFEDTSWKKADDTLWREVCKVLKVKRLGRMNGIKPDGFRSPRVEIIYGDNSWVRVTDGHVRYTWDVRYCMFSPGNATERFRVAQMNCQSETVVDMYAGIGYFTIPFLVHAKAACVHACEWNPHAVDALRKNLTDNKVSSRCYIHVGDNREVCPQNIADRVYLGLIPTCQPGIETACKALKFHRGGMLHLHENVCSKNIPSKNAFSPNGPLSRVTQSPSESCASPSPGSESVMEQRFERAEGLTCQKCVEIVQKYHTVIVGDARTDVESEKGCKFNYCASFTVKGCECSIFKFPSVEVNWKKKEWFCHAVHLSHVVCSVLSGFHHSPWTVSVNTLHHVKSYAPHIDHLVYDLLCSPVSH